MNETQYEPDQVSSPTDALIAAGSGIEPQFDPVMTTFLMESFEGLKRSCANGSLLSFASLGLLAPWLFRLTFATKGFVRDAGGEVTAVDRHVVALRFAPDYLRNANRFGMLRLLEPAGNAFHPNVSTAGAICVEIYPGESLVEICQSLHDLFRWRLRQYDERDALNPLACAWGRENIDAPIDDRPLFGRRLDIKWQNTDKEASDDNRD